MNFDKRYQVFISSTYTDLKPERTEVMQALLELDCIPCGMELFPATSETQWKLITRLIDDCDYYMVIVAGKYGSIVPGEGISYTEKEFDYALSIKKPVLAFIHEKPGDLKSDLCDSDKAVLAKLEAFRQKCKDNRCVRFYDSAKDLGAKVSRGYVQETKGNPQTGWVRANVASQQSSLETIEKLRKRIGELELVIEAVVDASPAVGEIDKTNLARGDEEFTFDLHCTSRGDGRVEWGSVTRTWDQLFVEIGPFLEDGRLESDVAAHLGKRLAPFGRRDLTGFKPEPRAVDRILLQFRALGLIAKGTRNFAKVLRLTPAGDRYLAQLLAVRTEPSVAPTNGG